jgi:hypothetical protein
MSLDKDHFRIEFLNENNITLNDIKTISQKYIQNDIINLLNENNLYRSNKYNTYNLLASSLNVNEIYLVGDSGHTIVPFAGMGITCGFDDIRYIIKNYDNLTNYSKDRTTKIKSLQFKAKLVDTFIHSLTNIYIYAIIKFILIFIPNCIIKYFMAIITYFVLGDN